MSVHPWPQARPPAAAQWLCACVEQVEAQGCLLDRNAPVRHARVAVGCLLQPEAGDSVLLLVPAHGPCFVLCVLERAAGHGRLRLPGGAELHGEHDGLSVQAGRLDLLAGRKLGIRGPRIELQAAACRLSSSTLELRAGRVQALLGSLVARGRECLTRLGRGVAEFGDSVRRVRGIDEVHAAQQRVQVEQRLHIRCRDASVVANHHVRIDARHIDLG